MTSPFQDKPGAKPPLLAGRDAELKAFQASLGGQGQNFCVVGVHGVGKTALLHQYRELALIAGAATAQKTITARGAEETAFLEIFIELVVGAAAGLPGPNRAAAFARSVRFQGGGKATVFVDGDRKRVLEGVFADALARLGEQATEHGRRAILFLDDFHHLCDKKKEGSLPVSSLVHAVVETQASDSPVTIVVAGLPTIITNLKHAEVDTERFFHRQALGNLSAAATAAALTRPLDNAGVTYDKEVLGAVYAATSGYPCFVQKYGEALWSFAVEANNHVSVGLFEKVKAYVVQEIERDFYENRFAAAAPREQKTLITAALLGGERFSVHELVAQLVPGETVTAKHKQYKATHRSLSRLVTGDFLYKLPAWGEYAYTLPLFGDFLRRRGS